MVLKAAKTPQPKKFKKQLKKARRSAAAPEQIQPQQQPDPEWRMRFVERTAMVLADTAGVPPSHARVLAWLVVCEPPDQSIDDIRGALGLSAAAVSTALATLVRVHVVERSAAAGGTRRRLYRVDPDAWGRVVELRRIAMGQLRGAAEQALAAAGPQPRLEQMRALYAWFERSAADWMGSGGPSHPGQPG